ncbi:MAG: OsmC family protein [Actinomycetaceae bacterium]|nr:OsmC family protein [Actinomycetaceae bacterium]
MANETFHATTTISSRRGLQVTCQSRGKTFILDEPESLGGTDRGMNPVEALLNALGACKCIVIKSFARSQGMDISGVSINLEGTLDPDGFQGKNPEAKIGFSKITSTYHFTTTNTPEELERFLEFVDARCPVMDTIVNTPVFEHHIQIDA